MKRWISFLLVIMMLMVVGCESESTDSSNESDSYTENTIDSNADEDTQAEATGDIDQDETINIDLRYMDSALPVQERVSSLLSNMTVEDMIGQMIQGEMSAVSAYSMTTYKLGSVLSGGGSVPGNNTIEAWQELITTLQTAAMETTLAIPMLYGIDAVHGHSNVKEAVIYPHNIGLGAANNEALIYEMGLAVGDEMKLTNILWNFSPCVAISADPRWGRTYESYSSDSVIVTNLGLAYMQGLQDAGVVGTAKHYAGDGAVAYGTGDGGNIIDRGDTIMSEEAFRETQLAPYKVLVDAGVDTVMISFSRFNGLHMHENGYLINDVLKGEMGFEGLVVSDWEGINALPYPSLEDKVAVSINAGIDMLMQPYNFTEVFMAMLSAYDNGDISLERLQDANRRILTVKMNAGLFEDPYGENIVTVADSLGSDGYRALAKELVSESLVLLKNEMQVLPLQAGQKVFAYGPAIDDIGVQSGGWTRTWQGSTDKVSGSEWMNGTTILEGLESYGAEMDIEIITNKDRMNEADVMILAIGEKPYAEMQGDTMDLSIVGSFGLSGNQEAIDLAKSWNKPVVALIVAGRQVLIDEFINDWDAVVMCYLPGTEGDGVADVLVGNRDFSGTLPMPWYMSVDDIGINNPELLFELGYGLTME
ncbi:MAG: glycoside hydrolase family 3 protein [Vallitaleaceae bacterium]|jgi:beta-glucosidase|nr:glycoside hydrolase family 3 protein [Vallitaleaceae bacterium]